MDEVDEAKKAAILPTIFLGVGLILMVMDNPFALLGFLATAVYLIVYGCKNYRA